MDKDLLSDLPLGIIHAILERVPIRDAVRTCILSSQWNYKWATLPHLTFDDKTVSSSETKLRDFINQLLLLHHGPILKFKLDSQSIDIAEGMYQWLSFLSRNGIRMLSLSYFWGYDRKIPSSIYSCQNLTHLDLIDIDLPAPPPSFKGFLCLKCLVLQNVDMSSDNTCQTLFAHLPLLEELKLQTFLTVDLRINASNPKLETSLTVDSRIIVPIKKLETCFRVELRINAPNLKNLCLEFGDFGDICICTPLLSEAEMSISLPGTPHKECSVCEYTEVLGGLTHIEKLKGNINFFEFLSFGIESCSGSLVFPLLRVIEITEGDEDDDNHWMKVMKPIKCILASSPVLEKLICSSSLSRKNASTLLNYPRASPNAKILYR